MSACVCVIPYCFHMETSRKGLCALLRCTVKFCGGCNPRYERGDAYKAICAALQDTASFSYPEDGVPYDVLLILRGCTGCPYLYEEIEAAHRVVVAAADEIPQAIDRIRSFTSQA